jgi:DnaK suppressor protein
MEQLDKEALKIKILEEIAITEKDILNLKEQSVPISPENAIGRISRMDAINNKSVIEASLREAEEKLSKLKIALQRIDDPSYGICLRCENPIPLGRIMLMPQSTKCVNCA